LLAGIDRSAGLDWWAYVTSVKSDPFFGRILTYAYQSSVWQLAAAILLLGFTRRSARLDMLSLSFIGCPSFHGVMAVLTVRALWGLPVSGPLALAANIPVMLSIPADGGHHFVDVAGGILVAFLSAAFANAILRRTKVERHQGLASRGALTLVRQALHFGKIWEGGICPVFCCLGIS